MMTLIAVIVIVFLAAALIVALAEQTGGYVGDRSMIPGCLIVMVIVVGIVLLAGFLSGHWGVWLK